MTDDIQDYELRCRMPTWYFNIGELPASRDSAIRSWEDNREFGFISAGRQAKSVREIRRLTVGDGIWAYLSRAGYVGYGYLTSTPSPAKELILTTGQRLIDAQLRQRGVVEYDEANDGTKEFAARVRWVKTFSRAEAKHRPGLFSFPGAVCVLRDQDTLDFLSREFGITMGTMKPLQEPHVWIEKTIVAGRSDREHGENALGKALWSPKAATDGRDIYRFMRDIKVNDIILHLTDDHAFTGISEVASSLEDFTGIQGTKWETQAAYRVKLRDFIPLEPPLTREVFFGSPYRDRLVELLKAGQRNLFYNSAPSLNQGAYLTPAPPALVRILDDAYRSIANKPLIDGVDHPEQSSVTEAAEDVDLFDRLVKRTYWTESALSNIIEAIRHPVRPSRQIILAGPPGTSKTFVAQELVDFLTKGDLSKAHLVQFHPSYSYEQFIEGLRPTIVDGIVKFQPVPGIVLDLAERCRKSQDDHFLIIDELNRANLSRVLGELMFLFEYRDKSIDLPYTRAFSLPKNLYFIATMNTADRNIRSIDIALRRRFDVFDCPADAEVLGRFYNGGSNLSDVPDLIDGFIKLNSKLTEDLDEYHTVGHAFFMASHFTEDDLDAVWTRKIRPLLGEYFFASPDIARSYVASDFWASLQT